MTSSSEKYVVITPVRDEQEFIEQTIQSIVNQTIQPIEWIIVNDGSTDRTGQIINQYVEQYSWIHAVHRENRGFRKAGGGVIDAFYDGYNSLQSKDWGFIVKLDGDLSFAVDYFENCFDIFKQNNRLGIGGGMIYHLVKGKLLIEKQPLFHVRGATKIYRKECWDAIDGLINAPGWDTLDEVKANMLGWQTQSFDGIEVVHHRFTGQADGSWRDSVKNGRANYISGYHPLFMTVKCIKRIFEHPYFIKSLGLFYGFMSGYWKRIPQVDDINLIHYLRKQQLKKLLFKDSIWK
jgi:glycosyltransferase involved in cell wall biosynthesis